MVASRPAPAKINLGLRILRRRGDGYHELESVFMPLVWSDEVRVEPHNTLVLTCSDPKLPTGSGNLVWWAAEALADWAGIEPLARLHLEKRVPYGAGLGSGSSDAAATLRLLARLWRIDICDSDLHGLAAHLGADVPFFLLDGPAVATGTGTTLKPLTDARGDAYRCPYTLVVAVPDVHVPTSEAYMWVVPEAPDLPPLAEAVMSNDLGRWQREVTNAFEEPVVQRFPEVGVMRETLRRARASWVALSGSGSSIVAAFERAPDARLGADAARALGARVHVEAPSV